MITAPFTRAFTVLPTMRGAALSTGSARSRKSRGNRPLSTRRETGLIEEALADATKTRFFTNAASSAEWVDWLDKRNHLDVLFGNGELHEQDNLLVRWLVEKFACEHADELFLLIGRHNMQLHPEFWLELCRTIGLQDDSPMDGDTLSRWVSLLLASAPAPHIFPTNRQLALGRLAECCVRYELMDSIIQIFDALAASCLVVKRGFAWLNGDQEDSTSTYRCGVGPGKRSLHDLTSSGRKY